jgi:hypothetical protein
MLVRKLRFACSESGLLVMLSIFGSADLEEIRPFDRSVSVGRGALGHPCLKACP